MAKETPISLRSLHQKRNTHQKYKYILNTPVPTEKVESSSDSINTLRLTSDVEKLDKLNYPLSHELATEVILNSFPPSYSGFIVNSPKQRTDKSLQELQGMLRINDNDIENSSHVFMIQEGGKKIKNAIRKYNSKLETEHMLQPLQLVV